MITPTLARQLFQLPLHAIIVETIPDALNTVFTRLTTDGGLGTRAIIPDFSLFSLPAVPAKVIPAIDALQGVVAVHADSQRNVLPVPFMPGERARWWPTSNSRKLLGAEQAFKEGFTGENVTLGVIDSVAGYSPVIVKDEHGKIDILPIEDLWEYPGEVLHLPDGEQTKALNGVEIYTSTKKGCWTPITRILRHAYEGSLIRLNTGCGVVDVSPNHSVIKWGNHNQHDKDRVFHACDIKVGDALSMPGLPKQYHQSGLFVGPVELAWLYGFFAAEGSANSGQSKNNEGTPYTRYSISFSQKDFSVLEKVQQIFEAQFRRRLGVGEENGVYKAALSCGEELFEYFRSRFYTRSGDKQVPKEVLNAPADVQEAFIEGYLLGDGHTPKGTTAPGFSTTSQTLAMGILWMMHLVHSEYGWALHVRGDKPKAIQVQFNLGIYKRGLDFPRIVKKTNELAHKGYLFDLTTEDNTFCTGVGPIRVHNTGVDPSHPQLMGAEWASEIKVPAPEPGLDMGPQASGHGSHCASTAAGSLVHTEIEEFVEGVSHAQLFCVQALGRVIGTGFKSEIISAILRAFNDGIRVFSMSLGSEGVEGDGQGDPEARVIKDLTRRGCIFVIAAGNSGPEPDTINSPGVVDEAITVAAIDRNQAVASFSSRGGVRWGNKPDMAAPGRDIFSGTGRGSQIDAGDPEAGLGYASISGTSMATPHVAGLVCLLRQKFPGITAAQIKATVREKAGRDFNTETGWGVPTWAMFS